MSVATPPTNYHEIIALLPQGSTLRLDDVSWEDYEQRLDDLGDSYAARIFYHHGRIEILAPAGRPERPKIVIHDLIAAMSDELDIEVTSFGSTTFKRETINKGAEPDDSFYIQNAQYVIGKEDLDLEIDPPSDLVFARLCTFFRGEPSLPIPPMAIGG
ncbi:MAG: Uma2 family endonuclease [Acidobacteria bacterium]|nr:Uma2 family endonuclease [Acidobacteriota bacterium]